MTSVDFFVFTCLSWTFVSTSTFCLSEGNCDFLTFGSASTFCLDEFTSIFSLDNFESVLFNLLSILFIFSSCSFIFADGVPSPFIIFFLY